VANKERIGKRDHPTHDAIGRAKANGSQKCVVQLDTKANERRGFLFPISSPYLSSNSCDEFLEPRAKPLTTVKVISY
jgi:hypothetical protein